MRALAGLLAGVVVASAQANKIDFAREVQPLLMAKCGACHMGNEPQARLSLHTRAAILKGGANGPAVVPGNSRESLLIQRVTGFRPPVMPFGLEPLSDKEIELLRTWIDQGAEGGTGGRGDAETGRRLALVKPALPEGDERANPIDRFVDAYLRKRGITAPAPVSDGVFLRRAYLDLWGLPPTPEEWSGFVKDPSADKRERLIDRLLAHRTNYSEHWISFWNDLLRNDEGVVYHGSRQSISSWLLQALEDNMPYDRFVSALLDPQGPKDPQGFLLGVNWRGDVSASQIPPMQAAQNSAQVFLGINLKCNSCHDSFISNWKLKDAYGLASFFSEKELEIFRCDVATGERSQPKFLFPELGGVKPGASLAERHATAARLFTSPENGRFPSTLVNRIWKRLMGRALIEPVDDMDKAPWDPDLLDWLASDFAEHPYDLKFLLRRIMTSRAYQLPAVKLSSKEAKEFTFRGPLVRRLTAEQFVDSISSVTGEWRLLEPSKPGVATPSREWRLKSTALTRALGRPIRDQVFTDRNQDATTLQALELVNGQSMARLLHRGARRMLGELKPPPQNIFDSGIVRGEKITVDVDITGARELRLIVVDADSYDRSRVLVHWDNAEFVAGSTAIPACADGQECLSLPVPAEKTFNIDGKGYARFRAVASVDRKSLQSDISPRVRFFLFTQEPDREQLVAVAFAGAGGQQSGAGDLVGRLYRHALGREPGEEERRIAKEFLSGGAEGLEDLLWSVFLSPEFQYIE